jgi:hypothetical protein
MVRKRDLPPLPEPQRVVLDISFPCGPQRIRPQVVLGPGDEFVLGRQVHPDWNGVVAVDQKIEHGGESIPKMSHDYARALQRYHLPVPLAFIHEDLQKDLKGPDRLNFVPVRALVIRFAEDVVTARSATVFAGTDSSTYESWGILVRARAPHLAPQNELYRSRAISLDDGDTVELIYKPVDPDHRENRQARRITIASVAIHVDGTPILRRRTTSGELAAQLSRQLNSDRPRAASALFSTMRARTKDDYKNRTAKLGLTIATAIALTESGMNVDNATIGDSRVAATLQEYYMNTQFKSFKASDIQEGFAWALSFGEPPADESEEEQATSFRRVLVALQVRDIWDLTVLAHVDMSKAFALVALALDKQGLVPRAIIDPIVEALRSPVGGG